MAGLETPLAGLASSPWKVDLDQNDSILIEQFFGMVEDMMPAATATIKNHYAEIKNIVSPIVTASILNEHGRLGENAARYALYRIFMERHGWLLKNFNLDYEASASKPKTSDEFFDFGRSFPDELRALLEGSMTRRGSSAVELSLFAAVLEQLIDDETDRGLAHVYEIRRVPAASSVYRWQAEKLIEFYMAQYTSGMDVPLVSAKRANAIFNRKKHDYHNWEGATEFFRSFMTSHAPAKELLTFREVAKVLEAIVDNFVYWNNHQCSLQKEQLVQMDDGETGTVRLLDFYTASVVSNGSSTFLETPYYLRSLGVLDETKVREPRVVMANYLSGPNNCVARNQYYSVCCMDECADLYQHLETVLGNAAATPGELVPIVEELSSASMTMCRKLPESLVEGLEGIAKETGGVVLLHGEPFAEWMHLAYPRECASPKIFGPGHFMTVEEWSRKENRNIVVEDADMRGHIDWLEGMAREDAFEQNLVKASAKTSQARTMRTGTFLRVCSGQTWSYLFCIASAFLLAWKLRQGDKDKKDSKCQAHWKINECV